MFERREDRGRLSAPCLCTPQCAVLLLVRRTYNTTVVCVCVRVPVSPVRLLCHCISSTVQSYLPVDSRLRSRLCLYLLTYRLLRT